MPSKHIDKILNSEAYYLTFTVNKWYYIFDRHNRWEILLEALKYCQANKNLKIYAFVFMLNHIHLLVQNDDVVGFIRDFKKYTSHKLMKSIKSTEPTVAELFMKDNGRFSIWKRTNMPLIVKTDKFYRQKRKYIEDNPVRKMYVRSAEHWIYSSAFVPCLIKLDEP